MYMHIYKLYKYSTQSSLTILVFINPEDGLQKISRNVLSFPQYYAASQPKRATTLNCMVVRQTWS